MQGIQILVSLVNILIKIHNEYFIYEIFYLSKFDRNIFNKKKIESDRFKNAVEIKSKYNVVIYLNLS